MSNTYYTHYINLCLSKQMLEELIRIKLKIGDQIAVFAGTMEEIFCKLKQQHINTVDNLIKWMQDAKLLEKTRSCEEKARALFADVADKSNVEIKKFYDAIAIFASERRKPTEEFVEKLGTGGYQFLRNMAVATDAAATSLNDELSRVVE